MANAHHLDLLQVLLQFCRPKVGWLAVLFAVLVALDLVAAAPQAQAKLLDQTAPSLLQSSLQSPLQSSLRPSIDIKPKLTLVEAVQSARRKYPSLQRRGYDTLKAKAEISVARTEYLPRMDLLYQELRATNNVTAGTILPQFLNVIPIQSGPPTNNSSFASKFGSNAGLNFSWELIDFGRRAANVNLARSGVSQTTAQQKLTELDVSFRAAHCYLRLLAAQQLIQARQATLERMLQWALVVHTLCDKGLRPGVDAYRADAEVSMARIALIDAKRQADLDQQDLAEAIGDAGSSVEVSGAPFVSRRNEVTAIRADMRELENHPLARLRVADVNVSRSRLHLLDRTWYPHLWFESGIWGRGSGTSRFISPIAGGVIPKTANWAVGFTLQFPVMQYFKVRADKELEQALVAAKQSAVDLAMQELIREDARAQILLSRAQETASETPVLVTAARENEIKAKERYRVGLTNVIEVAEAEQILARAESENAVAQINVWQAQLATAYAHGDLTPFLKLAALAEASH